MKFLVPLVALLANTASAQFSLPANPATDNNGGNDWGVFFDLTAGTEGATVNALTTGSTAAPTSLIEFEVLTFDGSSLAGVGSDVSTGVGASMSGWTSLGMATGSQAAAGSISDVISIPGIAISPGQTVGVCLLFTVSGPAYSGNGANIPYQTFSDGRLTLRTGDARSEPFTPSGSLFASRGLSGELFYSSGGSSLGTKYCGPGAVNSTGLPSEMSASGSSVVALNDVTLEAAQLPMNSVGFFLVSAAEGFVMNPSSSMGNLCLSGSLGRYVGPGQAQSSGPAGSISLAIDLTQLPQPNGFVSVAPGETWSFQLWHRDAVGGSATSNFTDGLRITFN